MKSDQSNLDSGDEVARWDRLAVGGWDYSVEQFWFHSNLLYPALQAPLTRISPRLTLDFGCGPGHLMTHLADAGFVCEGYDPAAEMADRARGGSGAVVYSDIDEVPSGVYDLVVANAVLSAVSDLRSAIAAIGGLLREGGSLVMSIPHPVFALLDEIHTTTERRWIRPDDGESGVWKYLGRPVQSVRWGDGLPSTSLYHRTLGDYGAVLAGCGFVITEVIEPVPAESAAASNPSLYEIFSKIPGFLIIVARLGRAGGVGS
ncbi:MAG TPA: class I SAM-dependent methyltransferase [Solirubrobacterales bacterium]|nr:class I SAM-dependent methyltransferase [Solirubrobacterales bacterium]